MLDGRLLVALTDSKAGLNAAGQAIQLAASTGSQLTAISVEPPMEGDLDLLHFPNAQEAIAEPHRKVLHQAEEMAAERGVKIKTILASGQPHEKVVDQADAMDASLIILGDSRRTAMERAVLGPTASRVVGYAQRDVLIIPEDTIVDFQRIVVATDGSKNSHGAVNRAIELAKSYGGKVTCVSAVHILPEYNIWGTVVDDMIAKAKKNVDDSVNKARERGIAMEGAVRQAEPAAAILDVAAEAKASLIVMGSHGRTGLRRLLMGSVAETVLAKAPCPTLIVP